MKFGDITKAIHDAWCFCWPPIVICIFSYWIVSYLNPEGTQVVLFNAVLQLQQWGTQLDEFKQTLAPYGLTTVVPLIFVVVLITVLYLINSPLTAIASLMPPHLSYQSDILHQIRLSREEKLMLIRKFPAATHFNQAYYMAMKQHDNQQQQVSSRGDFAFKIQNFVKLAFLLTVFFATINLVSDRAVLPQLFKCCLVFIILIGVWIINLFSILYNMEQQFERQFDRVRIGGCIKGVIQPLCIRVPDGDW